MNKNESMVTPTGIAVALAVVVALGFLFFGSAIFTPFTPEPVAEEVGGSGLPANDGQFMVTDTVVGTGAEVVLGSEITVHYVGQFENGEVFDASVPRGAPFVFTIGVDPVIEGWKQGLIGMKVGGKRVLVIPPELGYGPNNYGDIPGGSTLIFEVELLDVKAPQ
jgi:FKBP-type peptidyl-prolyl cis-trans isomerase FkpA